MNVKKAIFKKSLIDNTVVMNAKGRTQSCRDAADRLWHAHRHDGRV